MYTYTLVEKALASELEIDPRGLPAFAARLRHLRNLGIPRAKPGSGKRISYAADDVEQMLIALLLESLGCSPRMAATTVEQYGRSPPHRADLLVILPDGSMAPSTADRLLYLVRNRPVLGVLNLRLAFSRLEAALREQKDGK
jgi:hypothetical protein